MGRGTKLLRGPLNGARAVMAESLPPLGSIMGNRHEHGLIADLQPVLPVDEYETVDGVRAGAVQEGPVLAPQNSKTCDRLVELQLGRNWTASCRWCSTSIGGKTVVNSVRGGHRGWGCGEGAPAKGPTDGCRVRWGHFEETLFRRRRKLRRVPGGALTKLPRTAPTGRGREGGRAGLSASPGPAPGHPDRRLAWGADTHGFPHRGNWRPLAGMLSFSTDPRPAKDRVCGAISVLKGKAYGLLG